MEIFLNTGKEKVLLRGGEHSFELCWKRTRKDRTGKTIETWEAGKWFVSPEQALDTILKMKIKNCEAKSLEELKIAIGKARNELLNFWNTEFKP